ncbi:hypothetical protein [Nesterenkonia alba]|uniref:hypothetical protein n=1 Tax=Nesterenkonia alba TaxID=515814 RepID=UPI0012EC7858|nr:hypothetical protein [Nesterenkonia alba]
MVLKSLASVFVVSLLGLTPAPSSAAVDGDPVEIQGDSVIINGEVYGPEDGVEIEEHTIVLDGGESADDSSIGPDSRSTPVYQSWGASYVQSQEYVQFVYRGEAYAAANVWNGQRVVGVCFQYRRDGNNLHSELCSSARSTGSGWQPGETVSRLQTDSLGPNDPVTEFHYRIIRVDPSVN